MPVKYEIDTQNPVVRTTVSGVVTLIELNEYFGDLIANDGIGKQFAEYISFENIDDLQVSYSASTHFQQVWRRYKERVPRYRRSCTWRPCVRDRSHDRGHY